MNAKDINVGDIVLDSERAWVQVDDGVELKVLHVDPKNFTVSVLTKMAAGKRMPTHLHHCETFNYTLKGEWEYAEGAIAPTHSHAYEPDDVKHTPITTKSDMILFSVFNSQQEKLFTYDPDGSPWVVDINMFVEIEKQCIAQAEEALV